jgi:hypothetical protein
MKPRPLPTEPSTNPEISALRQLETLFEMHGRKLDRLYSIGTRLGFTHSQLYMAAKQVDLFLPKFEIAAKQEGIEF